MDEPVMEGPQVETKEESVQEMTEKTTGNGEAKIEPEVTTMPIPVIDYKAKKLAHDAKARRKDEKIVQQVLRTLEDLKTPQEKLAAMCKKYSELLHENRKLQGMVKESEKQITIIQREKEEFRNERSKAVLEKLRLEQLCRELQKLNKAQKEEAMLKLRVEEEKKNETCSTFHTTVLEMNTLMNQNNEKSARLREENLEMRDKIKSVRERIELTETQLDKVRQQGKLELELAREELLGVIAGLTEEKEALWEDKRHLLMRLAKYHVDVTECKNREQFLSNQIKICAEKCEEVQNTIKKASESSLNFRPQEEMRKNMLMLEKETAVWKRRWEQMSQSVQQMGDIKEKRDAEIATLKNKLSTLQDLCKVFQRERASLLAQLREAKGGAAAQEDIRRVLGAKENSKAMKQVEVISKDCEKLKDNLTKLDGSLCDVVRGVRAAICEDDSGVDNLKTGNKKVNKKARKKEGRTKSSQKKEEDKMEENEPQARVTGSNNTEEERMAGSDHEDLLDDTMREILKLNETVLKDIRNVLAEPFMSEAKVVCMKEFEESMMADSDSDMFSEDEIDDEQEVNPTEEEKEKKENTIESEK